MTGRVSIATLLLFALLVGGGEAQTDFQGRFSPTATPMDPSTSQLQGAPVTMRMLMEVTIFQIDVLTLELRIDGPAGDSIRKLVRERERTEETSDSVADLAADARHAYARLDFLRDISLDRFLDEVQRNAIRATEAGYVSEETGEFIARSLPEWYSFLEGRGIEQGDRMEYFIEGDTLTVHYLSHEDSLLMSTTDVGPERRRSVLGGYFARGSDFREGLLESLYRPEEQVAARP
ncbi:MAG: hypothetical protein R3223_03660 [Longimicrobiales bacterium]|nr:hypothetical protein [Longimicrobiales bacterium]